MSVPQGLEVDFDIVFPNVKSPAAGRSDKVCGVDWETEAQIRKPYKGVDQYVEVLPPVYHSFEASASNLNQSIPVLVSQDFKSSIKSAISLAREILDEYREGGNIDDGNFSAIGSMIDRAEKYYNFAVSLQDFWENYSSGIYIHNGITNHIGKWPLEQEEFGNGCGNMTYPSQVDFYAGPQVGNVPLDCPQGYHVAWHKRDRVAFRQLMIAAIFNCRCAQEAAATVGIYNKNKKSYYSRHGAGLGLQYAPKKKKSSEINKSIISAKFSSSPGAEGDDAPPDFTGTLGSSGTEIEPGTPGDPGSQGSSAGPEKVKRKKKDNSILIIGAAAIGFMLMKK